MKATVLSRRCSFALARLAVTVPPLTSLAVASLAVASLALSSLAVASLATSKIFRSP